VIARFGELKESAELVQQAWNLRHKANPWTRADLYLLLGQSYLLAGQRSRAISTLREGANFLVRFRMRPEGGVFERNPEQILCALGELISPISRLQPVRLSENELRSAVQALCS
jgi:hypothetical protein